MDMRKVVVNYGLPTTWNEQVANDILRLAYEGELFTTDGKLITLEYIEKVNGHERVWESIDKDMMNKLQTNKIEGYTIPLALHYKTYDVEEVKGYISEALGYFDYDIELYSYSFVEEEETFETFCQDIVDLFRPCEDDLDDLDVEDLLYYRELELMIRTNNVREFLKFEIIGSYDGDGNKVSSYTVKDEIKRYCYDNGEKFTTKFVAKVFMTCQEMLAKTSMMLA